MFSGLRCCMWWTISAGTSFPRSKHLSHMPGGHILPSEDVTVVDMYASRAVFHALEW